MKRKLLIASLIFIYSFTCLNVTILYALHNVFHEHHEISFHYTEIDQKVLSEENCTVFKVINCIDEPNATLKIKTYIESLSLHMIVYSGILMPVSVDLFFDPEQCFSLLNNSTIPKPPPENKS